MNVRTWTTGRLKHWASPVLYSLRNRSLSVKRSNWRVYSLVVGKQLADRSPWSLQSTKLVVVCTDWWQDIVGILRCNSANLQLNDKQITNGWWKKRESNASRKMHFVVLFKEMKQCCPSPKSFMHLLLICFCDKDRVPHAQVGSKKKGVFYATNHTERALSLTLIRHCCSLLRVHLKQWSAARGMTIKYTYVSACRSYATIWFFFLRLASIAGTQ